VTLGQIIDEDLGMHGEAAWVAVSGRCDIGFSGSDVSWGCT
jgi:hypothetical protein